jgi:DNA (cytosine-5)-methyltransferase 1
LKQLTSVEVCAGAGGQALGLEQAGFRHVALAEIDPFACETLRRNRPRWRVLEGDLRQLDGAQFRGVDLLAGGVPCPPFSVAGKQLGAEDERDLFPEMLRLTAEAMPAAVLIENVRGLLDPSFASYRARITRRFESLGYVVMGWRLLNASDFGVPQLRPRVAMVALRPEFVTNFAWPEPTSRSAPTVGEALATEMTAGGWEGAEGWIRQASEIAPTLVGGSRKHGGPDLGPSRARAAWALLGVDGRTIAEDPPSPGHRGPVRLTLRMAAIIQGFDANWQFAGRKTQAYRQVGNAFPPPVARSIGLAIKRALLMVPLRAAAAEPPYIQEELPAAVG